MLQHRLRAFGVAEVLGLHTFGSTCDNGSWQRPDGPAVAWRARETAGRREPNTISPSQSDAQSEPQSISNVPPRLDTFRACSVSFCVSDSDYQDRSSEKVTLPDFEWNRRYHRAILEGILCLPKIAGVAGAINGVGTAAVAYCEKSPQSQPTVVSQFEF
jgi:hypothetical protein